MSTRDANNAVSLNRCGVAESRASFADTPHGRTADPPMRASGDDRVDGAHGPTLIDGAAATRFATEVDAVRQRTRAERFASWRVGDKGPGMGLRRGVHDAGFNRCHPIQEVHLVGRTAPKSILTPHNRRQAARSSAACGAPSPDTRARPGKQVIAQQTPAWHVDTEQAPHGTTSMLTKAAQHGWNCPDTHTDHDWGTGTLAAGEPTQADRIARRDLAAHGDLDNRPSAYTWHANRKSSLRTGAVATGRPRGEATAGPRRRTRRLSVRGVRRPSRARQIPGRARRRLHDTAMGRTR